MHGFGKGGKALNLTDHMGHVGELDGLLEADNAGKLVLRLRAVGGIVAFERAVDIRGGTEEHLNLHAGHLLKLLLLIRGKGRFRRQREHVAIAIHWDHTKEMGQVGGYHLEHFRLNFQILDVRGEHAGIGKEKIHEGIGFHRTQGEKNIDQLRFSFLLDLHRRIIVPLGDQPGFKKQFANPFLHCHFKYSRRTL